VPPRASDDHAIVIHLDKLLADRGMTLTELSDLVGVSVVNLSILKNGHARAIRFSTLTRLCHALDCQPGDLLTHDGANNRAGRLALVGSRSETDRLQRRPECSLPGAERADRTRWRWLDAVECRCRAAGDVGRAA
jgi:putative transcriptional regulator